MKIQSIALAALVAACSGGSPSPRVGTDGNTAGTSSSPIALDEGAEKSANLAEGTPIGVNATAMPERLVVDGSFEDWGPGTEAPVRLAIDERHIALAVDIPEPANAVSLALTTEFLDYPDIGWIARSGHTISLNEHSCRVEQRPAGEGMWKDGAKHPPEVVEACLSILRRHERDAAAYREKFVARFRLTRSGVTTSDGVTIPGARHAARGRAVEVALPIAVAPAFMVAPVTELLVHATAGPRPRRLPPPLLSPDPTEEPDPRWSRLILGQPLTFSTLSDLRAEEFQPWEFGSFGWMAQRHYLPGAPDTIQLLSTPISKTTIAFGDHPPPRLTVVKEEIPLYRHVESLEGEVEVGIVAGYRVMVKKGGRVMSDRNRLSELRGVVRRNQALHLISYEAPYFDTSRGARGLPSWKVLEVTHDGKVNPGLAEELNDGWYLWHAWDDPPTPFSDDDFHMFGMKGTRRGKPRTVRYVWYPGERRYKFTIEPPSQRVDPMKL